MKRGFEIGSDGKAGACRPLSLGKRGRELTTSSSKSTYKPRERSFGAYANCLARLSRRFKETPRTQQQDAYATLPVPHRTLPAPDCSIGFRPVFAGVTTRSRDWYHGAVS
jgi:hypothetical protein